MKLYKLLIPFYIVYIRYLQYRSKKITIKNYYNQNNQILSKLIYLQHKLYYYKSHFQAWGYFHRTGLWSTKDEKFYRWLFPNKNYKELDIVIWYNPEAVTYYQNKIYDLSKGKSPNYEIAIVNQLIEWENYN